MQGVLRYFEMRALFHPPAEDLSVEAILHALSDPVRVAIYAQILGSGGPQTCSDFLHVRDRNIPKSTLSQHFKVLREAGLIRSERRGVEMHSTSRLPEIERRFPGLIPSIVRALKVQTQGRAPARRPAAVTRR
jgi:DNA-binding transcriptional ArsR family regulator